MSMNRKVQNTHEFSCAGAAGLADFAPKVWGE